MPPITLYCLAAGGVVTAVYYIYRNPKRAAPVLAALFFICGLVRVTQDSQLPMNDISRYVGQQVTISGIISEPPQVTATDAEAKVRYIIQVEKVRKGIIEDTATGKLIVGLKQSNIQTVGEYGDKIIASGEILELHGYNNPGVYDTVAALKRKGITARLWTKEEQSNVIQQGDGSWQSKLFKIRSAIKLILYSAMAESDANLLNNLLLGGYSGIKKNIIDEFSATGIIHILSVSGTHVSLIALVALWIGQQCRLSNKTAGLLAATTVIFYALLAGLTPPVARATVMGIAALAANITGRDKDGASALALAALALLAIDPRQLYDISFQLSFCATAGLVYCYSKTVLVLSNIMPRCLTGPLAVTISAQLGVLPLLAGYFHSFSLSSFVANIIVVPILEAVVVFGLGGCLVSFASPIAGKVILALCALAVGAAVHLNQLLATVPGMQIYLPSVGLMGGSLYYLTIAWAYNYLPILPRPGLILRKHRGLIAAGLIIAFSFFTIYRQTQPVSVHFIDVGQGDATLIITPHRRAVLVDTGGTIAQGSDFDIGERVVVPYLKHQGVISLDYLILTHGHQDHAGGAAAVASSLPVKTIIVAAEERTGAIHSLVRHKKDGLIIPAEKNQRIVLDGVSFTIVHGGGAAMRQSGNETSSVIRVDYGQHSFLLTGDLETKQEQQLLDGGVEPVTVLKVGHHGSKTSTSRAFLEALNPYYAVISVGANNRFGHPHRDTMDRLAGQGVNVLRTDQQGAIIFFSDGQVLNTQTFLKPKFGGLQ